MVGEERGAAGDERDEKREGDDRGTPRKREVEEKERFKFRRANRPSQTSELIPVSRHLLDVVVGALTCVYGWACQCVCVCVACKVFSGVCLIFSLVLQRELALGERGASEKQQGLSLQKHPDAAMQAAIAVRVCVCVCACVRAKLGSEIEGFERLPSGLSKDMAAPGL